MAEKTINYIKLPDGETYKIGGSGSGSGFNLFDTKTSDHVLEGEEALGWALQGTYVSGVLYPDFYNECLTQKNLAVETEVTLGDNAITIFKHNNGHQFFNIADKTIVDAFFETFGIADFYGIDEENERVFLPRNKYFHQLTLNTDEVNNYVEAGLPDHTHAYTSSAGRNGSGSGYDYWYGSATVQTEEASASNPIYGNSDTVQPPSSLKLLYYCVGNTVVNDADIDAGSLVAQMETKANIQLDNVLPSQEFKTMSASYAMPSDNYIDLELGASDTIYTAPADGYVWLSKHAGGDFYYAEIYVYVGNTSDVAYSVWSSDYRTSPNVLLIPVKKGARFGVGYNATGKTNYFRFVYAKGSEGEAS